jgi:hypothetical protein
LRVAPRPWSVGLSAAGTARARPASARMRRLNHAVASILIAVIKEPQVVEAAAAVPPPEQPYAARALVKAHRVATARRRDAVGAGGEMRGPHGARRARTRAEVVREEGIGRVRDAREDTLCLGIIGGEDERRVEGSELEMNMKIQRGTGLF